MEQVEGRLEGGKSGLSISHLRHLSFMPFWNQLGWAGPLSSFPHRHFLRRAKPKKWALPFIPLCSCLCSPVNTSALPMPSLCDPSLNFFNLSSIIHGVMSFVCMPAAFLRLSGGRREKERGLGCHLVLGRFLWFAGCLWFLLALMFPALY